MINMAMLCNYSFPHNMIIDDSDVNAVSSAAAAVEADTINIDGISMVKILSCV